jgi:two-component system heavy metal sensor histidine kinase CusS
MRSIRTRIAVWYALSATVTLAILFAAGYVLLENYIDHDLDLLNRVEFEQIRARLGRDYHALTPDIIDRRIRETTNYASVLFYININIPGHGMLFYSSNLAGRPIPDIPRKHIYNASVPGIGGLRVAEFIAPPFDITVGTPTRQMHQILRAYVEVSLALLAAMLLISVGLGFGLGDVVLRPVRLIGQTASRIRSDNLDARIPVAGVDNELSDLAKLLNQMFDRIEGAFKQMRVFTAEVSHELKTPLSLVRLHAEKLLTDGNLQGRSEEAVLVQLEELGRVSRMIDELLFISRAEAHALSLRLLPRNPHEFLRSIEGDLRALCCHRGIRLDIAYAGAGSVAIDEQRLRQVLFNLVNNALDASSPRGEVRLCSSVEQTRWCCRVEDDGPGLEDDQYEKAFNRFVRFGRAPTDTGSGLGLAICRSIIELHGGVIRAMPCPDGRGACFCFELPLADAAMGAGVAPTVTVLAH